MNLCRTGTIEGNKKISATALLSVIDSENQENMKVVGFSFIRNAEKYNYPVVEALSSILPLCDELVVAVGNSEDNTRSLIEHLDPKIRIVDTVWDESLNVQGHVLAAETDKAFQAIDASADWCIYIQ